MGFPGPGSYDENKASEINGKGATFWSKFKSSTSRSITGKPKDIGAKYQSKVISLTQLLGPAPISNFLNLVNMSLRMLKGLKINMELYTQIQRLRRRKEKIDQLPLMKVGQLLGHL
jgi:hypothetical protein